MEQIEKLEQEIEDLEDENRAIKRDLDDLAERLRKEASLGRQLELWFERWWHRLLPFGWVAILVGLEIGRLAGDIRLAKAQLDELRAIHELDVEVLDALTPGPKG